MSNTECAKVFIEAIKTIAEKSENIDNLECYLEKHFVRNGINNPILAIIKSFFICSVIQILWK